MRLLGEVDRHPLDELGVDVVDRDDADVLEVELRRQRAGHLLFGDGLQAHQHLAQAAALFGLRRERLVELLARQARTVHHEDLAQRPAEEKRRPVRHHLGALGDRVAGQNLVTLARRSSGSSGRRGCTLSCSGARCLHRRVSAAQIAPAGRPRRASERCRRCWRRRATGMNQLFAGRTPAAVLELVHFLVQHLRHARERAGLALRSRWPRRRCVDLAP